MDTLSRSLPTNQNSPYSTSYGASKSPLGQPSSAQLTARTLKPFVTEDIKILLLEDVNKTGRRLLLEQGYQVRALKTSLPEDELVEKIRYVFVHTTSTAPPLILRQRCPCYRNQIQDQTHRKGAKCSQEPHRHRLFLHRHKPG